MRFCWRNLRNGCLGPRCALSAFIAAFLVLSVTGPAFAQMIRNRKKDKGAGTGAPADAAEAAPKPVGPPLTKTQAVFSLVQALAVNPSDAALKTLEDIVEGKISFGAHNTQSAEMALVALTMRQSPAANAYLIKLISTPDDTLRKGMDYSGPAVRIDAVRVIGRVGSPDFRAKVAKVHDQVTPEIRSAIETALLKPSPASFAAQVVLMHSHALPDVLRFDLQKQVLEQNAVTLKSALGLTAPAAAPDPQATAVALMAELSKIAGGGGAPGSNPIASLQGQTTVAAPKGYGGPAMGGSGAPERAAAAERLNNPVSLILEFTEKTLNAIPADPAIVARDLWQADFVEAVNGELTRPGTNTEQLLTAIGSIPLKSAREHLRTYLLEKAPHEIGKPDNPASHAAAGAGTPNGGAGAGGMRPGGPGGGGMGAGGMGGMGRGGAGGMRGGMGAGGANAAQGPMFVVGPDWLDPGALIVLKSLVYKDRPKARHHTTTPGTAGHRSAAAEKKAEEAAEKQKVADMSYEWRDTIERFVTHWDERLAAVAKASGDEAGDDATGKKDAKSKTDAAGDSKSDKKADKKADKKSGASKTAKADEPSAKKSTHEKGKGGSSAPIPSVPVPFVLRPGEHITKEFHLRWPEDLPPNLTAAVKEPLVVHYIQLEGTDEINRTATFYRSAMSKGTRTKTQSATHDIGDEKWVDVVQHDLAAGRTRTLDVIVTREPSTEPEWKRAKIADLTIQVLMVEVEAVVPEKGADKEEAKEAKNESP